MVRKPAKKTSTAKSKHKTTKTVVAVRTAKRGSFSLSGNRYLANVSVSAVLAEFIGTFVLALVVLNFSGNALLASLVFMVLVLVLAPISGPNLNPALTVGLWAAKRLNGSRAVSYLVAQVVGAMLALVVANAFVPDVVNPITGQVGRGQLFTAQALPAETAKLWRATGVEAIGMFVFALGAASAYMSRRGLMAKAFTLGGSMLFGLLLLQGSPMLNPALALSVQALKWSLWPLTIYVVVPLVSTVLAMLLWRALQRDTVLDGERAFEREA
ncbi:MAG: hypothetical protein EOT04_00045 [Candidatus Chaera renei]|uniref:Aquaporin n=1 Tax=Candidatus Chaera renei TaxID=2506947 RepID=A0A4Q0AKG0_9BACT|nr:MAG: hypothetical protein EOT04_00045 [Candidatus Chaera renei]